MSRYVLLCHEEQRYVMLHIQSPHVVSCERCLPPPYDFSSERDLATALHQQQTLMNEKLHILDENKILQKTIAEHIGETKKLRTELNTVQDEVFASKKLHAVFTADIK